MKGRGYLEIKDLGMLEICEEKDGISSVNFRDIKLEKIHSKEVEKCIEQLKEYFAGKRKTFDVKLDISQGTEFQQEAWKALLTIPYGETRSYQDQAIAMKNSKAVRAVGGANHNNPISIIIPCHRVIGKNGKLTGYGGGLFRKEYLLDLEKAEYRR
ncbi:methylated-DNA--[protein]-cysteine S-methyltransferase [Fusobacterium ulcerans]|uniref:methylated-DNA--[protein]-cysteine S-methyltransferase n=1 Tax=Fusobacterium ulcerans TaxID=861 RepID=UPI001D0BE0F0|nr:methylated-DNA--[protein]-cysteine S-methyltransferase [Fusobacterium ulcerans]MCB8565368.1 methylated-DNA--[protein]-cysteine S-methyltransferase [Fusobacterium ulcerans]MCB8649332.1 methylated-DNA--[protein]-cysteine S-methyltransferase [Fusobacterium ulcerans]